MGIALLLGDKRAVSPVIGVILMVAITVILAAVIGAFVLGIGGDQQTTPRATFEFEQVKEGSTGNPDELQVTLTGGDAIPNDELHVTASVQVQDQSGSPGPADRLSWAALGDGGSDARAGDSVIVEPPNGDPEIEDDRFRVIWVAPGNATSATLSTWSGPSA